MRLANALGERVAGPRAQVGRVVGVLGLERAEAFYRQALEIEEAGGMMLPDGSRRRTLGGVFFKLVRDTVTEEQHLAIFLRPCPQQLPSQPAPHPLITELPNLTGEARTVKIALVGRPGRIIAKQGYIMTTMRQTKLPALPKGMPVPPTKPTTYTVYIGQKQWAKVAPALKNPEDVLIAEGTAVYDAQLEGIAVYVTNATTKQLQQAQRAAQSST